jgi:hypothetical protein
LGDLFGELSLPPTVVKDVEDLIYWQYAKIIAQSAGFSKKEFGFVTNKFKQLKQGDILWNEIREYIKERQTHNECIFCQETANLTLEHMLPQKFNGPNTERNLVWICRGCNSSKGAKRLYEYYVFKGGLDAAKYGVPRIAEGKYLKFAYEVLQENHLLNLTVKQLTQTVCPTCDLKPLCIKEDTEGKFSTLCLDGILTLCFKNA